MPVFNNILAGSSGQATGYDIDQSLRFNRSDGGILERTPLVEGNRRTITISVWCKIGALGITNRYIFDTLDASSYSGLYFVTSDKLQFFYYTGGAYVIDLRPSMLFRDSSAWYHIVAVIDTTQSVEANRAKIYVNGEQITDFHTEVYPSLNLDTGFNVTYPHAVGTSVEGGTRTIEGYLAEFHYIDGTALTPASLGETDAATNQWKPIEATGLTYGTNGFYQKYSATELATSFTDSRSTGTPHTLTAVGNVTNTRAQSKFSSSSVYSYAWNDNINCSPHVLLPTEFTWEGWVRFENATPGETAFFNLWDGAVIGGHDNRSYRIWYQTNTLRCAVSSDGDNPNSTERSFSWTPSQNTWYYISVGRDSSYDCRAFVDGTQVGVTQSLSRDAFTPETSATEQYLAGQNGVWYQDVQFSSTNRYTTTYSIPTASVIPDSDTVFLVNSDFDGGLGADSSGNKNDFAVTNLVATDQMIDTPTNNYCTFNPLFATAQAADSTYKEGNLEVISPAGSSNGMTEGTISVPSSGKWYWEHYTDNANYQLCGIAAVDFLTATASEAYMGFGGSRGYMNSNGNKVGSATYTAYGDTWTTGDIIGVAVDMDNGSIYFAKNNTWQDSGDPTSGASKTGAAYTDLLTSSQFDSGIMPGWSDQNGATTDTTIANFGQDSSFAGNKTAQGNGGTGEDFYYTPPTGYVALNSDNLSDPAIALPTDHFTTNIWSGDGTDNRTITTGFDVGLSWIKRRDIAKWHSLSDSVRAADPMPVLYSNSTSDEATDANALAFVSNGFTVDDNSYYNTSGGTFVGWNWKAGGTAVANTDGSIPGTVNVSANTTAGFSIVSYTGDADNTSTVGHGLSVIPDLIIMKCRSTAGRDWVVGSTALTSPTAYNLVLNTAAAEANNVSFFTTAATSSVWYPGDGGASNGSGLTYIAYCFHSIEGYSKVGSFTGNGNADGPFIYTDMAPSFVMFKNAGAAENWRIIDNKRNPYNVRDLRLMPSSSSEEIGPSGDNSVDFLSNGFKLRTGNGAQNQSTKQIVYLAFAESPFKTSNAR